MEYRQLLKRYMTRILELTDDDFIYYDDSNIELSQVETDELSNILDEIIEDRV